MRRIWLLYECEQWEPWTLLGIFSYEERAKEAKIRLDDLSKIYYQRTNVSWNKNYHIDLRELDAEISPTIEWYLDTICLENKSHAYLGTTCSICDHVLKRP